MNDTGDAGPHQLGHQPSRKQRLFFVGGSSIVVVVADQITKSLALSHLARGPVHLFGPFGFALAFNTGAAFSLGTNLTLPIVVIAMCVVVLLAFFARAIPTRLAALGVGMVLGGAISNLGDRFFRGHDGAVVDFIHVGIWPTFNIADACIVCGCILLGAVLLFSNSRTSSPNEDSWVQK